MNIIKRMLMKMDNKLSYKEKMIPQSVLLDLIAIRTRRI